MRPSRFVSGVLFGVMVACDPGVDIVAASSGDYNPKAPPEQLNLAGDFEVHNPFLFKAEGRYYVYSSGTGLLSHTSDDLGTFTAGPSVFATNPDWIATMLPDTTDLWSPSVIYHGNAFHLYFAASVFAENTSCIGHASRASMTTGTWVDRGYLLCTGLGDVEEDYNAIDPSPFVDDDGQLYLTFGSYQSGVKLLALDEFGGKSHDSLVSLATRSAANPAIQAPSLMKRGGYYYLFVSFDQCCSGADSTYSVRVGRSIALQGPYVDRNGIPMLADGGSTLLESDTRWKGPGSSEVFVEGKERYLVHHAYDAQNQGRATLRISELRLDNAGWPVVAGP